MRGTYRGIFSALVDDPDFQALSPQARHVFLTLRVCLQLGPAGIFRYYPAILAEQTGLDPEVIDKALAELAAGRWVIREGPILWIRNALRHDPAMRLSDAKHRKTVDRWLSGLPKLHIVLTFCDYYGIPRPFDGPSMAHRGPSAQEKEYEKEYEKDQEQEKEEVQEEEKPKQRPAADAAATLSPSLQVQPSTGNGTSTGKSGDGAIGRMPRSAWPPGIDEAEAVKLAAKLMREHPMRHGAAIRKEVIARLRAQAQAQAKRP